MDMSYLKSVLLKDGHPIIYDIKDEFKTELRIDPKDNNITKLEKFKAYKPKSETDEIDCDVSEFAVFVYNKVWLFLQSVNRPSKQYKKSPYTVYNFKYQLKKPFNQPEEYYRGDTMVSFKNIYDHSKLFQDTRINYEIEKFAKLYHTLGNMIPIPSFFNFERSGKGRYDFWDLVMKKIKEWYKLKNNIEERKNPLKILLNPIGENTNLEDSIFYCEKWLNYFKTWNSFVLDNYLEAYIIKKENAELLKDEDGYFEPIELWKKHSYESANLPQDKDEFLNYLKLLNGIIEERNIVITKQIVKL